jgi:hypothetical protein
MIGNKNIRLVFSQGFQVNILMPDEDESKPNICPNDTGMIYQVTSPDFSEKRCY